MRFDFIDEITGMDPGRSIAARRTWPADLDVFQHHFPGMPVVPGVLLTEMMGQAAALCIEAQQPSPGKAMLVQIRNAQFRRWVRPDERLDIDAEVKALRSTFASVACRSRLGAIPVAEAELLFSFIPWTSLPEYRSPALERHRATHRAR